MADINYNFLTEIFNSESIVQDDQKTYLTFSAFRKLKNTNQIDSSAHYRIVLENYEQLQKFIVFVKSFTSVSSLLRLTSYGNDNSMIYRSIALHLSGRDVIHACGAFIHVADWPLQAKSPVKKKQNYNPTFN